MQFTLRTAARRARRVMLAFALLLAAWAVPARSAFNTDYIFQSGSGTLVDTTGMTIVHSSGADDNASSVFSIGFSCLYGWIAKRLLARDIAAEFSVPMRGAS